MIAARVLVCGGLLAVGPAGAVAQVPASAAVQVPRTPSEEFPPVPSYLERVTRERPVLSLSIADVVDRTMHSNLDIVIERYNQVLARQRLVGTRGFYDPSIALSAGLGTAINPLTPAAGDTSVPTETIDTSSFGPSVRQNLVGGATVSAGVSNTFSQTSSVSPTVNPAYGSVFSASVTQPLLRGFVYTATDRLVKNGALDVTISDAQYRLKVTQVLQQVLNQYWELVFAMESYEARRQSRNLAVVQYESTRLRVQAALLVPIALTAARAEIAGRERDMLQAEVQIINAENALKQLLSDDPASPVWGMAIVPTDRPAPADIGWSVEDAVRMANDRRPELDQLRLQARQNAVDRKFYSLERRPIVNLTAGLVSAGKSGTVYQKLADGRVTDTLNPAFGRYQTSWRQVFGFDFLTWSVNLNVQVPIRNRAAESLLDQARVAESRFKTQMTRTVQSITVEVRNLFQVIDTLKKSLDAARLSTALFEEQLAGQTARYEAGFSNEFELLRYQRDLVDARVRELRALVDLQEAMISLQKATDTLLGDHGVSLPR